MALTDLSRVTQTLTTLLGQVMVRDTNLTTIEFSAAAPDDTSGAMPNVINVHLYHATEDPHGKNFTPPEAMAEAVPVQQTPLALWLYYIVTATSSVTDEGASVRALIEQRLLGFVARAFHDFPVLDDSTVVPSIPPAGPNPPLLEATGLNGAGNEIQIILSPTSIDETVNFWSAEQDRVARLSLQYQVRVILFDTPRIGRSAPPVLSVAEFVSVSDRVEIVRSRSLLGFPLPSGHPLTDPTAPFRFFEAVPARPSLFPPGTVPVPLQATVPPANDRLTLEGGGFGGARVSLSLAGPMGTGGAAPEERRIRVSISDPVNPEWAISADGVRVSFGMRTAVTDEDGQNWELYPGVYRMRIIVRTQVSGEPRFLERASADCPVAVAAQIGRVAVQGGPPAARLYRITLHGSYLRDELDVSLSVAGRRLLRDSDLSVAGRFDFDAAAPDRIDLSLNTTDVASPFPVQLSINGAAAPPAWGEV